jgi:GNAT superfamily N-acetyltransferase
MDNVRPPSREELVLRDGRPIVTRDLLPGDAPRLEAMFPFLSAESIYRRFFVAAERASPELVRRTAVRLARIDPEREAALAACDGDQIVAVARFACLPDRPQHAEASILVRDDYQRLGLGRQLFAQLIGRAEQRGLTRLILVTHHDNLSMIRLAQQCGRPLIGRYADGLYELEIQLAPDSSPSFPFTGAVPQR